MSTKADLEVMVTDLKQKLKEAEEELQAAAGKRPVVNVSKDRKFEKFSGTGNFQIWHEDMKQYVDTRFKDKELQKVTFVYEHLVGNAKKEVRFRLDITKCTADNVFQVLDSVFGTKQSTTQLLQKFYGRNQLSNQSTEDYAYILIDIMTNLRSKEPKKYQDCEAMMKEKFADGVNNQQLKRELKRLNFDRPELKFWELRDRAIKWMDDEKPT